MSISSLLLIVAIAFFVYAAWKSRPSIAAAAVAIGLAFFAAAFLISAVVVK